MESRYTVLLLLFHSIVRPYNAMAFLFTVFVFYLFIHFFFKFFFITILLTLGVYAKQVRRA